MKLFVGDDWAQDHHDVEVMDGSGCRLTTARSPEGAAGMARLHAIVGTWSVTPWTRISRCWSRSRPIAGHGWPPWPPPGTPYLL